MKLTVLVDNNTYIDNYFYAEPAVSYYIEDEGKRILFDAGYSDIFIKNALAFRINLKDITDIVVSHGHNDHTGGLKHLFEQFDIPDARIIAHQRAFNEKRIGEERICSPFSATQLRKYAKVTLSDKPVKISSNVYFLGEIPPSNDFEERKPIGKVLLEDGFADDLLLDDTAIAYNAGKGTYIVTGCSHSGICNIIEYSKHVCGDDRILGVIGGFHLFDVGRQLEKTIEYFLKNGIREVYPCHCVSFKVKAEMHKYIPVNEVGVSMELDW